LSTPIAKQRRGRAATAGMLFMPDHDIRSKPPIWSESSNKSVL